MVRPLKTRFLSSTARISYFKSQGIPLIFLEEIILEPDEFEAIKLHDHDDLNQIDAAQKMNISQPTFARILDRAHKKNSSSTRSW